MLVRPIYIAILGLLIFSVCPAQEVINFRTTYFPWSEIIDSTSLTFHKTVNTPLESFAILNPRVGTSFNSHYPRGYNDGPIWKGKGLTIELHGGIAGKKGKLSYVFYPALYYSQNSAFETAQILTGENAKFRYHFIRGGAQIDWVQRYGNGGFVKAHPGQSEIKMDFGVLETAISTINYSLGPSMFNPILLSHQAGGFPHLRIGTEPFDLTIRKAETGKWEFNYIAGLLKESDYFDTNAKNNDRFFNGIFVGYSPKFLPELTLGFNKVLYKDTQFFENKDLFSPIYIFDGGERGDSINTNDTFDQVASISLEWNLPKSGFKAYLEFAKNDFTGAASRFLLEPEHSRAYTIGFEKAFKTKKGKEIIINYEHTNLSINHTYLWRATPSFYLHHVNKQGYTNDGQIIGAGIGPGGNSALFGLRIKGEDQILGFLVQRIEANKDYFIINVQGRDNHDIEYSIGTNLQKKLSSMILSVEGIFSYNYNRYYLDDQTNIYLSVSSIIMLD